MAAPIDIGNRALTLLGENRITSFDQQTKGAAAIKSQYDLSRLSEIRAYRWGFAMRRAQLPALVAKPIFGFAYAYELPADFVKLDFVGDTFVGLSMTNYRFASEAEYAIEGRQLLHNHGAPLNIRYLADIKDSTYFDTLFVDSLSHRIAIDICEAMTQSTSKLQSIEDKYKLVIGRAISNNAIERPPEPLPDDTWVTSRL